LDAPELELQMPRRSAPVVVATDLTSFSDGAVRFGAALARRGEPVVLLAAPAVESGDATAAIDAQLVRALGTAEWPGEILRVAAGGMLPGMSAATRSLRPSLVVVPRAGALPERSTDWEFFRSLLCRERVPAFAAHPSLAGLPRVVIVTVDFSRSSLSAARTALRLVADDARVFLVHVQPDIGALEDDREGWGVIYAQGIAGAFSRLVRELRAPPGVHVEPVVLEGSPESELLAFDLLTRAELIVAGTHRSSFRPRTAIGSVTAALLSGPARSLLLTPAEPAADSALRAPLETARISA
jgi:nucleotide-binding universal stress UspA family protein